MPLSLSSRLCFLIFLDYKLLRAKTTFFYLYLLKWMHKGWDPGWNFRHYFYIMDDTGKWEFALTFLRTNFRTNFYLCFVCISGLCRHWFGMQKYFKRKFANRKGFGFCEDLSTCWEAEKREQLEDWNVYRKWEEKVNCSPHYSQTEYKG